MSFRKTLACFLFAGLTVAVAQEEPAPAPVPVPKSQGPAVKALILVQSAVAIEFVTITGDKKISPKFLVGASTPSDAFFPGRIFNLAIEDASAETGFRTVTSVKLPEAGDEFILLLEPVEGKQFRTYIVNGRQPNFRADSVLFFNSSDTTIGVSMDNKKAVIKPREIEIASAPAMKDEVPFYSVAFYYPDGEKSRMFGSSRWLHRPDGRNYVFIFKDKVSGEFGTKILDESL